MIALKKYQKWKKKEIIEESGLLNLHFFLLPLFTLGFLIWQCGLLDMPALVQLAKDAKYALAYQLLKIFLTGRLSDYLDFQEANSELLKTYG